MGAKRLQIGARGISNWGRDYKSGQNRVSFLNKAACLQTFCFRDRLQQTEAATGAVLRKKVFLKILQNLQESTCARVCFLIKLQASASNFIKKKTITQVFFYEFFEIFKNTFLIKHLYFQILNSTLLFRKFFWNFQLFLAVHPTTVFEIFFF